MLRVLTHLKTPNRYPVRCLLRRASHGHHCTMAAAPGTAAQGLRDDGWYTELSSLWPGQGLSLKVDEVLYQGRSEFQDIAVFKTGAFGKVLVLDGAIQCTERDEFSYQEMIAHLPLCALARPAKKVLVVGGGDGGVLRELSRHSSLEAIHMAEIDGGVVEAAKIHFPGMAIGFSDPRVSLHICDGIKFVQDAEENTYDAIIVDSSDPVGPAEVLFQQPFFEAMHRALKPGGVVCTQGESLWYHLDIIKGLAAMCHTVFVGGTVQYAFTTIPTYPSGQIGFMICSKADPEAQAQLDPRTPKRSVDGADSAALGPLKYYSPEVHSAAFVLPAFAKRELQASLSF
ncbi:SPD1 [Auxenochlorella protothecoides x Auxenochlorella symbiontica]